jgi:hypothetical protein
MAVARSVSTPFMPILANIAVSAANNADSKAYIHHMLFVLHLTLYVGHSNLMFNNLNANLLPYSVVNLRKYRMCTNCAFTFDELKISNVKPAT